VIWRTCLPERSEATRRWVEYDSVVDLFRVAVLRINMARILGCTAGRRQGVSNILWHYKENPESDARYINMLADVRYVMTGPVC
jgi:hypothetical protein